MGARGPRRPHARAHMGANAAEWASASAGVSARIILQLASPPACSGASSHAPRGSVAGSGLVKPPGQREQQPAAPSAADRVHESRASARQRPGRASERQQQATGPAGPGRAAPAVGLVPMDQRPGPAGGQPGRGRAGGGHSRHCSEGQSPVPLGPPLLPWHPAFATLGSGRRARNGGAPETRPPPPPARAPPPASTPRRCRNSMCLRAPLLLGPLRPYIEPCTCPWTRCVAHGPGAVPSVVAPAAARGARKPARTRHALAPHRPDPTTRTTHAGMLALAPLARCRLRPASHHAPARLTRWTSGAQRVRAARRPPPRPPPPRCPTSARSCGPRACWRRATCACCPVCVH